MKRKELLLLLATVAFGMKTANAQETITLTTNTSTDIIPGSVACSNSQTGAVTENHYFKKFDLEALRVEGDFNIQSFQFGVQSVHSARGYSNRVNLQIKLWKTNRSDFPANWGSGDYVELASKNITVTNANNESIVTVNMDNSIRVEADDIIIAQVSHDDLVGQTFYIGSNSAHDNQSTYIMAPGCNIYTPTRAHEATTSEANVFMSLIGIGTLLNTEDFTEVDLDLALYPNPVSDQLTISSGSEVIQKLSIIDMLGRTIQTIKVNSFNQNVNVSTLPSGMYLMEVELETGRAIRKFIKK